MKLNATVCNLDFATMDDKKKAEAWVRWFMESENYKLIKEKADNKVFTYQMEKAIFAK